jgi:uncharacterized protein YndB with AHSA1/START domain
MTTQKDFKRLVRGRMQKTGESYTTARATLLKQRPGRGVPDANGNGVAPVAPAPAAKAADPSDFARLAGMSDAKIRENTGCNWERWVWTLDQVNAQDWPHPEIARYVKEKFKVRDWWTQAVTVGYERIRGLRERGQRRSGSWEASKSRTIGAGVSAVFKAFKQPKLRSAWLPGRKVAIRTAVPNKSMRITWEDGTSVELSFASKGRSKSMVAVQHTRLPSREAAAEAKAFWDEHLNALAGRLEARTK